MDLGPCGQVTVCNHFHRELGNISDNSWMEIFRGSEFSQLRAGMLDYRINEFDCRHCARQIRTGIPENSFAREQYDHHPGLRTDPSFPALLTFRLSNFCNLACIMCSGDQSSRIRREREKLPPIESPYGDAFFEEMAQVLPKIEHVEFFGGEPFLVKEHLRILELIKQTGSACTIYVNTNCTVLTDEVKTYLELLNFTCIAVSMDAVSPEVHARVRCGIPHSRFLENLDYLFDLRRRRPLRVMLNVTETRFNWFEIPSIYEFAAENQCYIHINTCLHPADCTLYDLPMDELTYVADYLECSAGLLGEKLDVMGNRRSYGHLLAMIREEMAARLEGRTRHTQPLSRWPIYEGLLAVPDWFETPFSSPECVMRELDRLEKTRPRKYSERVLDALERALREKSEPDSLWDAVCAKVKEMKANQ
jgi:wyosine [tRNA(Phe)-imidazoG37] synthetase (radical SAM superfamily)